MIRIRLSRTPFSFLMLIKWTTLPQGTLTVAILVPVLPVAWTDASLCCTTYISATFVTIMWWFMRDTVRLQLWASLRPFFFFGSQRILYMNTKAFKHIIAALNRRHRCENGSKTVLESKSEAGFCCWYMYLKDACVTWKFPWYFMILLIWQLSYLYLLKSQRIYFKILTLV